jgi:DNA anti-recombination protein RmuC
MPPELQVLLSGAASSATGLLGFVFGRARNKAQLEQLIQQNKTLEFERLNAVVNELQEQNKEGLAERRELKNEIRAIKEEHAKEIKALRDQYTREIQALRDQSAREQENYLKRIGELESQVAHLEAKLAEERARPRRAATGPIGPAKEG